MAARLLVLSLAAALGSACVQDDGSRWTPTSLVEVSESEEREAGFEFDRWARENLPIIEDPVVMGFINDLGQSIVETIEPQPFVYRFRVINDPVLNAFAVPGGYIYFHSATIARAGSLHEVAGVMGHEIAHVKRHHYKRMVERNAIPQMLTQIAAVGAAMATKNAAPLIVAQGVNVAFQLQYSRGLETEADRFGAVFMTRSGYRVEGMGRFFSRILAEPRPIGVEIPPYLYTHPDVKDRIEGVHDLADELSPVTEPPPGMDQAFRRARVRVSLLQASGRTLWLTPQLPADKARSDPALARAGELAERGDREEALAVLAGAERNARGDPRLPYRRGELLEQEGRMEEAVAAYRRAVDLDPTTGLVLLKLGNAYANTGDRLRGSYYLEQATLHLGEGSALRKRAEQQIEQLEFPVIVDAGLADDVFDNGPGREQTRFAPGEDVVWWARIGGRHMRRRDDIVVRWTRSDGVVLQETAVRERRRPWVESRLPLPAEPPPHDQTWSVEAFLEGQVLDHRNFRFSRVPDPAGATR
jgi:predicted Zn-dependent protease